MGENERIRVGAAGTIGKNERIRTCVMGDTGAGGIEFSIYDDLNSVIVDYFLSTTSAFVIHDGRA
jgi:hypothetical protein